jgi:AAA15 family ATPase/GTPase
MLNRIHIKGYKSLRDVEVRLQPLSLLFGPNATGKSNFLDALQLLSKIVSSRTLKDAFDPPYRGKPLESFSFGADGIKGLLAQDALTFYLEVDFTLSAAVVATVNR